MTTKQHQAANNRWTELIILSHTSTYGQL